MKRIFIIAVICFIMLSVLISWSWAQGETTSQPSATSTGQTTTQQVQPSITWGDYKYTFNAVEPSSDIDPQSVIMHWETPSPYNVSWDGANYCHFWIHIEWPENLRPWDYMPLQLIIHTPNGVYHQFGKDCSNASFLWRRYCRYPNVVGNSTDVIFTMDTQGASIDSNTAWLEVNGVLEVWDWSRYSSLYTPTDYTIIDWARHGSTYNSITHLADIPIWEILYGTSQ